MIYSTFSCNMRRLVRSGTTHLTMRGVRHSSNMSKIIKDSSDAAIASIGQSKLFSDFKELWNEAERRKYNTRWITIGCAATTIYIFYGIIVDWLSDQAADVTSKYLDNPKFKKDIIKFAEDAVNELVKSKRVQNDIVELLERTVIKLTDEPKIKEKLADMFIDIFRTEGIKNAGAELSNDVVLQLLHSEKFKDVRQEMIQFVIDEMIKVVKDEELQKNVGMASWNAFKVWFGMTPYSNTPTVINTPMVANDIVLEKT